jgi:chemotaxis methyl-accepting protein methylase
VTDLKASEQAIERVGSFLNERIGLRSEGTLRGRLRRAIADEAAVHGDDLGSYAEKVCRGGESLAHLVNRITVQESGFFRHPEHFEVLANSILPAVEGPVTIWSAACGNGQEAYSLAMLLEERAQPGRVIASDLCTAALARTAKGWYSAHEISGISPQRRQRHLVAADRGSRINARVQARVESFEHNLVGPLPGHVGSCQVVFCRNVLIYLSAEYASAFLDSLADALAPGAYLLLGAAESLWQVTDRFEPVRIGGTFVYRRRAPKPVIRIELAEAPATRTLTSKRSKAIATATGSRLAALPGPSRRPGRLTQPTPEPALDQAAVLARTGNGALAAGDYAAAVVNFRKWSYLAPEDPMGPFHLGLALEAAGHRRSARRAFAVARAVLGRTESLPVDISLEGFAKEELLKLLDAKQVQPS